MGGLYLGGLYSEVYGIQVGRIIIQIKGPNQFSPIQNQNYRCINRTRQINTYKTPTDNRYVKIYVKRKRTEHLQEYFKNIWGLINNEKSRSFGATLNTNSVHGNFLVTAFTNIVKSVNRHKTIFKLHVLHHQKFKDIIQTDSSRWCYRHSSQVGPGSGV